jgi:Flp pilus assembly protein TadG
MRLDRFGNTRSGGGERGAALVEFALILPLLAMIVFGSLTAGLAYQEKQDLLQIAREGARYGATLPSGTTGWATAIQSLVEDRSTENIAPGDICVALVTGSDGTLAGVSGHYVNTFNTNNTCFAQTSSDIGERVQVAVRGTSEIQAIVYTWSVDLAGKATAKFED